jgi:bifunctional UDP-N-acetylglucosamine pyrophosphorylase/glucosamine-1-phosphate N-acetyltransferase
VSVQTAQPASEWEVLGVNSRDQLAQLERVWQREHAQRLMASGVTLADPARIDVRGALACGTDVTIDVGCVFEGKVSIGNDVMVGPHCVIKDSTIEAGSRIAAYSHLDGAHVGPNGRIGPYARLRPGARLGTDVHVGNFVEIKASTLDDGAKANHLAYLGDSEIGKRVNVGAGTITCNYDGANKYKTIIEDDAFIGSDTQLVAPVRVGKGATLGAGTTLTKDAPADQLTVSRAKQVSIPGWKRPTKHK